MPIDLICLDADDTLWGHESYFQDAARRYHALLEPFAAPARTQAQLALQRIATCISTAMA